MICYSISLSVLKVSNMTPIRVALDLVSIFGSTTVTTLPYDIAGASAAVDTARGS